MTETLLQANKLTEDRADNATPAAFHITSDASNTNAAPERQWKKKEAIKEGFKNKTRGEAWFNGFSYIGIGYGLVTATSVFMTWLLNDTHAFAKKYGKFAAQLTDKLHISRTFSSIATLFIGGTIASVLPVKWLEDKKPQIVKKLDRMLYTDEELNDPKIKEAHKELDELPKQTWGSVFGSRVVAFAATLGVFLAMGSNKSPLYKYMGESIDKRSIQFGRWFDRLLHRHNPEIGEKIDRAVQNNIEKISSKALKDFEVLRDEVNGDRVTSRVWSYISLDAFYTLFTSASLFIFTRVFGGLIGKTSTEQKQKHNAVSALTSSDAKDDNIQQVPLENLTSREQPTTSITKPSAHERVAEPGQAAAITA